MGSISENEIMIIISGSSNQKLAADLAANLNCELGEVFISTFANGERRVRILAEVSNRRAVLIQSFSDSVDSNLVEFLLLADSLERAGAREVTAVIPWLGYSLQDKVFLPGEPIAARVVADMVAHSFVHKVILLDLHNPSIAGFFSVPTIHLRALDLFVKYARENFGASGRDMARYVCAVSPDFGGLKQARVFADKLSVSLANVDKHRDLVSGQVEPMGLSGEVDGKICLVYDDVINTGGTVVEVAKFLKLKGAREVHFLVTHGLFASGGLAKIKDQAIDSIVITDSVYHQKLPAKVKVLPIAKMVGERL